MDVFIVFICIKILQTIVKSFYSLGYIQEMLSRMSLKEYVKIVILVVNGVIFMGVHGDLFIHSTYVCASSFNIFS